jgi:uncharacterized membrane protein SirB2
MVSMFLNIALMITNTYFFFTTDEPWIKALCVIAVIATGLAAINRYRTQKQK